ncbi:MAG: hypothetical protein ACR2PL_19855 [Dehalococcoidia bacterium]
MRNITLLRLFETHHRSPQPFLGELGPGEWLPVLRLPEPPSRPRQRSRPLRRSCCRLRSAKPRRRTSGCRQDFDRYV